MLSDMAIGGTCLESVSAQVENASARDPNDKQQIDDFIGQGPGFPLTNTIVTTMVRKGLLVQAHLMDRDWSIAADVIGP